MAGWLRKQPERYQFRDKLDHVIRVMHERTETNHIMVLAAGLESLVELDRTSPYDSGHIELLVNGACAAAKEAGINIKPERLRGLLSLLRKENLGNCSPLSTP
jgi:hypothetical protein